MKPPHENGKGSADEFAPNDLQDGRSIGEWSSKYDRLARKGIRYEAIYLVTLFFLSPVLLFIFWIGCPNAILHLPPPQYQVLSRFSYVAFGGLLGGTLFGMKWLYHVVAKGLWHEDRRLWRILTPLISAALAFSIGIVVASNLLEVLDPKAMRTASSAYAIGFLVGYFSDSALAKLAEIAKSLFGVSERHRGDR